jgi:hypothetical protein
MIIILVRIILIDYNIVAEYLLHVISIKKKPRLGKLLV